jgi:hypothetical protein
LANTELNTTGPTERKKTFPGHCSPDYKYRRAEKAIGVLGRHTAILVNLIVLGAA